MEICFYPINTVISSNDAVETTHKREKAVGTERRSTNILKTVKLQTVDKTGRIKEIPE